MPKNVLRATGGLNKDVESYLLPQGDYVDANNIVLDTSISGGAGAVKTIENISQVASFPTGLTNPQVKAAVVDNLGVLYVLVKGETYAKIFQQVEGGSFIEKVKYTHSVTTDFVPDLKIVGNVLVWNYHLNGTPLSWYVERTPTTITDITDLTLIKKPPTFNFDFIVSETGQAPTDLTLSASTFSESLASGGTVATITASDTVGETELVFTLSGTDSGNFAISDADTSNNTATLITNTTFSYAREEDRAQTIIITVTDSSNLSYSEQFNITLTGANPTITESATSFSIDDDSPVGTDTGIDIAGTSGTADPANTEGLVFTSSNPQFEVVNGNLVTATALTAGSYNIVITVTNAAGNTADSNTIVATINAVNSAPVASDVTSFVAPTGTEVNHIANFSVTDANGDDLTYEATLPAEYGGSITVYNSQDRMVYTPPQDASVVSISQGNPITYIANDGTVDSNTANIYGFLTTRPIVIRDTVTPGTWQWNIDKMYLETSDVADPAGLSLATYTGTLNSRSVYGKNFPVNTAASGSTYLYIVFTLSKSSGTGSESLDITLGSVGSKITNPTIVSRGTTSYVNFTVSAQFKIKCQLSTVVQPIWSTIALDSFININPLANPQ